MHTGPVSPTAAIRHWRGITVTGLLLALALLAGFAYYSFNPNESAVSGTISYDRPAELSKEAKLVIQIRRITAQRTAGKLIAEQIIANPGQPPIEFRLEYEDEDINQKDAYGVAASILEPEDRPLFVDNTVHKVITFGNAKDIEINLVPSRNSPHRANQEADKPAANYISGSIDYDQNIRLPEGARLVIRLQEVGHLNGMEDVLIAGKVIPDPGRGPLEYRLAYNANDLSAEGAYILTGHVYGPAGNLILANRKPQVVVSRAYLDEIETLFSSLSSPTRPTRYPLWMPFWQDQSFMLIKPACRQTLN